MAYHETSTLTSYDETSSAASASSSLLAVTSSSSSSSSSSPYNETPSDGDPMTSYPVEYLYNERLSLYAPPAILVVGIVGNVLSLIIWTRSCRSAAVSTYVFLAVLSVTDTLVLLLGLLKGWLSALTGVDVGSVSDWGCKLLTLFAFVCTDFSVWLIIAVTAERYIAVCHPLRSSTWCTVGRAAKVIALILSVLLLVNFHLVFTAARSVVHYNYTDPVCNVTWNETMTVCGATAGYEVLVFRVWPYLDLCLYSFLPFLILLVLNSLIIHKVSEAASRRRHYVVTGSCCSSDGNGSARAGAGGGGGGGGGGRAGGDRGAPDKGSELINLRSHSCSLSDCQQGVRSARHQRATRSKGQRSESDVNGLLRCHYGNKRERSENCSRSEGSRLGVPLADRKGRSKSLGGSARDNTRQSESSKEGKSQGQQQHRLLAKCPERHTWRASQPVVNGENPPSARSDYPPSGRTECPHNARTECPHGARPDCHQGARSEVRLTVMLLTISFTFLVTTLPMNIVVILNIYWNAHLPYLDCASQTNTHARMQLATTLSRLLMYANHSANFYLYCATGQKFRRQLRCLFTCRKQVACWCGSGANPGGWAARMTSQMTSQLTGSYVGRRGTEREIETSLERLPLSNSFKH